jgi:hypothetical protein
MTNGSARSIPAPVLRGTTASVERQNDRPKGEIISDTITQRERDWAEKWAPSSFRFHNDTNDVGGHEPAVVLGPCALLVMFLVFDVSSSDEKAALFEHEPLRPSCSTYVLKCSYVFSFQNVPNVSCKRAKMNDTSLV